MDPTIQQWQFRIGDQVKGADDKKIGKIIGILTDQGNPKRLIVEKGRLTHSELEIPVEAVSNYAGGIVYVDLTGEQASSM